MPQGYFAAEDAYTYHYNEITKGIEGKVKIIDDTLLYNDSIEQHFDHVWDYLTLCTNNGISPPCWKVHVLWRHCQFCWSYHHSWWCLPLWKDVIYHCWPYKCMCTVWPYEPGLVGVAFILMYVFYIYYRIKIDRNHQIVNCYWWQEWRRPICGNQ